MQADVAADDVEADRRVILALDRCGMLATAAADSYRRGISLVEKPPIVRGFLSLVGQLPRFADWLFAASGGTTTRIQLFGLVVQPG